MRKMQTLAPHTTQLHPQFIKDAAGASLVVLPRDEYETLIVALEDLEDVMLYDQAMREDNGERILLADYIKTRGKNA
ncbi:MAG: hypothetical protein LBM61_07670 [Prevotellaceae bacterium]|jgi:hypothetical protein|nr:hypothetical protein [Prevotellaceae bacterium]